MTEPTLTVRRLGPQPALCPGCLNLHFPWISCEQAADEIHLKDAMARRIAEWGKRTPMADVPAALRGPSWPGEAT